MHQNNYYFIRKLTEELKPVLRGAVLYECYSQNKDELVLGFVLPDRSEFFIVAHLGSEFSSLYFPKEVNRARKNTITLFEEVIGQDVIDVLSYENERLFEVSFSNEQRLFFKLFGNRSNIILFDRDILCKIFKNNLKQDKGFVPGNRKLTLSIEAFREHDFLLNKVLYTSDELFVRYLETQQFSSQSEEKKYTLIQEMLQYLGKPSYYITRVEGKVVLSLFPLGEILQEHSTSIDAVNAFYPAHFRYNFLESKKQRVVSSINAKIKSAESYILKNKTKLNELEAERSPAQLADIIMANLHQIQPGMEQVLLTDFYSGEEITIRLKKDQTAQKNAELLYKKAKRKPVEAENLIRQIDHKEKQLEEYKNDLSKVEQITNHKDIEGFEEKYRKEDQKEVREEDEKFKIFELMGFKILVGKNAENNDELTQRYAAKNDLWLHAKDVSGSHVVVKFQAGKKFPKPVIEAAASLAAYYSKRRNETLCPVIYTEKKYVRKVKGAAKGEVKVERESVIMVEPKDKV